MTVLYMHTVCTEGRKNRKSNYEEGGDKHKKQDS